MNIEKASNYNKLKYKIINNLKSKYPGLSRKWVADMVRTYGAIGGHSKVEDFCKRVKIKSERKCLWKKAEFDVCKECNGYRKCDKYIPSLMPECEGLRRYHG